LGTNDPSVKDPSNSPKLNLQPNAIILKVNDNAEIKPKVTHRWEKPLSVDPLGFFKRKKEFCTYHPTPGYLDEFSNLRPKDVCTPK